MRPNSGLKINSLKTEKISFTPSFYAVIAGFRPHPPVPLLKERDDTVMIHKRMVKNEKLLYHLPIKAQRLHHPSRNGFFGGAFFEI